MFGNLYLGSQRPYDDSDLISSSLPTSFNHLVSEKQTNIKNIKREGGERERIRKNKFSTNKFSNEIKLALHLPVVSNSEESGEPNPSNTKNILAKLSIIYAIVL